MANNVIILSSICLTLSNKAMKDVTKKSFMYGFNQLPLHQ